MEETLLFARHPNDGYRVAPLPEQVAQVAIGADLRPHRLTQPEKRQRIVNHEVRVHLERKPVNSMLAGELRRFLPIRNEPLLPLPILHFGVFGWPAVRDPVGLRIGRSTARASGKTDNDLHSELLGQQDRTLKGRDITIGNGLIRMYRIAMTT